MRTPLTSAGTDLLFTAARTHNGWKADKVTEAQLRQIYDIMKMGPTSANCSPARVIFVTTPEGKEKLRPALSSGNLEKTMSAPVTAIIGYDTQFYNFLPELFPHTDAKPWFTSNPALAQETAFRNGSLQGAYFIMAVRSLGLDAGPMSGFDQDKVNQAFWPDGRVKVNFLCNIGVGDETKLFGRSPRMPFERFCEIV